jgi:hypothetical protein
LPLWEILGPYLCGKLRMQLSSHPPPSDTPLAAVCGGDQK